MLKANIRKEFILRRKALPNTEIIKRSENVTQIALRDHRIDTNGYYHIFLSIKEKKELDTWPLIKILWQQGAQTVAPITNFKTKTLENARLTLETIVKANKRGIPEPIAPDPVDNGQIHTVFVPLLAFDPVGHRVGYGGGYYDKLLADLPDHVAKIGLSLFEPCEPIDDILHTDISLDMAVTPDNIYQFS
jgi:5-formyltetrahydrofolate cyclo-ligase